MRLKNFRHGQLRRIPPETRLEKPPKRGYFFVPSAIRKAFHDTEDSLYGMTVNGSCAGQSMPPTLKSLQSSPRKLTGSRSPIC